MSVRVKNTKEGTILKNIRILEVGKDYLIGTKGYRFFRYSEDTGKWMLMGKISDKKFYLISFFRMLSRLLRVEVHYFKTLRNGQSICVAKNGIFRFNAQAGVFTKCFDILRGTRPLNICEDKAGNIFFGEYFHNPDRESVHIYMSSDQGVNWKIVYTFPAKSIRHIHGLHFDEYTDSIWVTTGDLEGECIIGRTKDTFRTFDIVFRGGQEFRACNLLFYKNKILYGTDSETAENQLKQFDRETLVVSDLANLQGSVINSVKIGDKGFLCTTVEPSEINKDQHAYIWMVDDLTGKPSVIAKFRKDRWDHIYFQFGLCRFPEYTDRNNPHLYFSGIALKGIDGHSVCMNIGKIKAL